MAVAIKTHRDTNGAGTTFEITDLEAALKTLEVRTTYLDSFAWDNSANAAQDECVPIFDDPAAVVGTTAPRFSKKIYRGSRGCWVFKGAGRPKFTGGMYTAAKQEIGVAGATPPTAALNLHIKVSYEA